MLPINTARSSLKNLRTQDPNNLPQQITDTLNRLRRETVHGYEHAAVVVHDEDVVVAENFNGESLAAGFAGQMFLQRVEVECQVFVAGRSGEQASR